MEDYSAMVAQYTQRFREGYSESDYENLLDMSHDILPYLMKAFEQESDTHAAQLIVEIIWQHRQPSVIPFLGRVLYDSRPAVWKQALDGLVTLASPQALAELRKARDRQFAEHKDADEFRLWLDEAISQTEAACLDKL